VIPRALGPCASAGTGIRVPTALGVAGTPASRHRRYFGGGSFCEPSPACHGVFPSRPICLYGKKGNSKGSALSKNDRVGNWAWGDGGRSGVLTTLALRVIHVAARACTLDGIPLVPPGGRPWLGAQTRV
jgi:hypothetical protein